MEDYKLKAALINPISVFLLTIRTIRLKGHVCFHYDFCLINNGLELLELRSVKNNMGEKDE